MIMKRKKKKTYRKQERQIKSLCLDTVVTHLLKYLMKVCDTLVS